MSCPSFLAVLRQCLTAFGLLCAFSTVVGTAHAETLTPQMQAGLNWLRTQDKGNGTVGGEAISIALTTQTRAETAITLKQLSGVSNELRAALQPTPSDPLEWMARKALALQILGQDTTQTQQLISSKQNPDGGWGENAGYNSNPLDTAFALQALSSAGAAHSTTATTAFNYLSKVVQGSGQYELNGQDALYVTAQVGLAASYWSDRLTTAPMTERIQTWLLSQRNTTTLAYSDTVQNAHALMVHVRLTTDRSVIDPLVTAILNAQSADGSWGADPYITAIALRALWMAQQPFQNPDIASVSGKVVDETTQAPIAGATFNLIGSHLSATTGSDGRFVINNIPTTADQFNVQATGYLSLSGEKTFSLGKNADLGVFKMKAKTASNASTVTITGITQYTDDGSTYYPARYATVEVGGISILTDFNYANFEISGVPPGYITLKAAYGTYPPVQINFEAQAGEVVRVDPLFINRATDLNQLTFLVKDLDTNAPITNANVTLNGVSRRTSVEGGVTFAEEVKSGDNLLEASAAGYVSRNLKVDVQGFQQITVPILLTKDVSPSSEKVIQGVAIDATTLFPLPNVHLNVEGTSYEATTDYKGLYHLEVPADWTGKHSIVVRREGYQALDRTVTLGEPQTYQLDWALQPILDSTQPPQVVVSVFDEMTKQPIAGAKVILRDSNSVQAETGIDGQAVFTNLNAGLTEILVNAEGYETHLFTLDLRQGGNYALPVFISPEAVGGDRVYGYILDAQTRRPISGAVVRLAGQTVKETLSDATGFYEFDQVSHGRWMLSSTAANYLGSSRAVQISGSLSTDVLMTNLTNTHVDFGPLRTIAVGHPNDGGSAGRAGHLYIFGLPGTLGKVVSNDGKIMFGYAIGATSVAEIVVPPEQFLDSENTVLNKALQVYANAPVSAAFLNRLSASTDISFLFNIHNLGKSYRILSWGWGAHTYGQGKGQFSVTAVEDGTTVTVVPSTPLASGQTQGAPFNLLLNKGQSVLYTTKSGSGNDPTGTLINTDKPVAVFSGFDCAYIPKGTVACDHIFTQLPPAEHWADEYVIPETAQTGEVGNLVRIVANQDGTEVRINGNLASTLSAGSFYEIEEAHDLHIQTNAPVLVGQYLKGKGVTGYGDPALTFMPGTHQTRKDYLFAAPVTFKPFEKNFLNLAIPTAAIGSLKLNDMAVNTQDFRPILGTNYSRGVVPIELGPGRISADQPFLVTITGMSDYDSYHSIVIGEDYPDRTLNPVIASIAVSTDQLSYPAQAPVILKAMVANTGQVSGQFKLQLRLIDAQGQEVLSFPIQDLLEIPAGATLPFEQPWDTATYLAGTYTLIGTLLDKENNPIHAANTLFKILPTNPVNTSIAKVTVQTDRAYYTPTSMVKITDLLRNLTTNATFEQSRLQITVKDPEQGIVFTHTHAIDQLTAGALRTLEVTQPLKNAALGRYTVEAQLISKQDEILAGASTQYTVVESLSWVTEMVITATRGTPQSGSVSQPFELPLEVIVQNNLGEPISGVRVVFRALAGGTEVDFPSGNEAITDTQGRASVTVRAGAVPGSAVIFATADSVKGQAQFNLTLLDRICGSPNAPIFAPLTQQPYNTPVVSNSVALSGIGSGCTVDLLIENGEYKLERAGRILTQGFASGQTKAQDAKTQGLFTGFTATPMAVQDGDILTLAQKTSAQPATTTTVRITLGKTVSSWAATTRAIHDIPASYPATRAILLILLGLTGLAGLRRRSPRMQQP